MNPLKRVKLNIYETIEKKSNLSRTALICQLSLGLIIIGSTLLSIWETVPENDTSTNLLLAHFQDFCGFVFVLEYVVRLWIAPLSSPGQSPWKTRLLYFVRPMMLVDLFVILPFMLPYMFDFDVTALRVLRLIRIMRIARIGRFSKSLNLLVRVIKESAPELLVSLAFSFLLLIVAATGIYHFERDAQPGVFSSIPESIWWAINVLTGVTLGDFYPITFGGKVFAGLISLLGVGTIALPAGIIASGIMDAINKNRSKEDKREQLCDSCHNRLYDKAV